MTLADLAVDTALRATLPERCQTALSAVATRASAAPLGLALCGLAFRYHLWRRLCIGFNQPEHAGAAEAHEPDHVEKMHEAQHDDYEADLGAQKLDCLDRIVRARPYPQGQADEADVDEIE